MNYTAIGPAPHNGSPTSVEAANSWAPENLNRLRKATWDYLVERGEYGATDQEMQAYLDLPNQSQTPRRWELVRAGLVMNSGRRRKTLSGRSAIVWVITPTEEK